MPVELRRTLLWQQTTYLEGWKAPEKPTLLVAAFAIIKNPWFRELGPQELPQRLSRPPFGHGAHHPLRSRNGQARSRRYSPNTLREQLIVGKETFADLA